MTNTITGQGAIEPGVTIADKYEVTGKLGEGGMGVVLKARHIALDRPVAIKMLHEGPRESDQEFRARFSREARVMSRLEHPNAVAVYDYGEYEGALFIVMELLHGHSLDTEMRREPLDRRRALEICAQMCDVLTVTHEIGLIHRDIKPENIFITDTEAGPHATLVDFGLAFIASDEDLSRMTREGLVAGTPQFLSPEQAQGLAHIGPPSDIYSLGCVFYEMLCGAPVVTGKTLLDLFNAHVFVPATSMRVQAPELELPAALDNLVLSMLAKDPAGRPSAFEVSTLVRKLLASEEIRGRGRPERLLAPRHQRAVTAARGKALGKSNVAATGAPRTLGILGSLEKVSSAADSGKLAADLQVAGHAAGWQILPFTPTERVDILLAADPDLLSGEICAQHPVVAVVGEASISRAVDLLKLGVEDVLVDAEPADILRKARQVYLSTRRRARSEAAGQSSAIRAGGVEPNGVEATGVEATGVEATGVEATGVEADGVKAGRAKTRDLKTSGVEERAKE